MLNASRTRSKVAAVADDLTAAELEKLFGDSDGLCPYCERLFSKEALTLDHVIPLVAGGANSLFNLLLVCAGCNARKKGLTVTGKALREIRNQLGLTQQELADLLETSLNTISRWEIGAMAIRSPGAIRLALKYLQGQRRTKGHQKA